MQLGKGDFHVDMSRLGEVKDKFRTPAEHVRADHCPGLGDQRTERPAGIGRADITPQCLHQGLSWDRLQPRKCEVSKQQPTLTSREEIVDPPARKLHGEWAAELHPGGLHDLSIADLAEQS